MHAASAEGVGGFEGGEFGFIGEEGVGFDEGDGGGFEELDGGPAVGGFAGGVGHGIDVIEAELFGGTDLAFGERFEVGAIFSVGGADEVGGEHHCDGHEGEAIDGLAVEVGEDAFFGGHGSVVGVEVWRAWRRAWMKRGFVPQQPPMNVAPACWRAE
ncbi:MAG: hypothetical protein RI897_140 [Verrucomicrobiota bacterium]